MNERIKELAKKAGYRPLSPPTFADELNEIFIRKLAELIVRECAEVAADVVAEAEGVDFGLIKVCYRHFGVEE